MYAVAQTGVLGVKWVRATQAWAGIALLLLTICLFFWGIRSLPLSDPDAGMYADIGTRMAASGDWMTPRFNGLRYLEKPPLLYWLIALIYRLTGPSEWGAHLWPAIAGVAGVAMTYGLGREMFGPSVGLLSGLILATSIGYFAFAKVVSTDLLFVAFLSLALLAFWRWYRSQAGGWRLLLHGGMGFAVMTKGVIGLLLPGLIIASFLALTRDLRAVKRLGLWWGIPLVVAIALPWHLGVALLHEGFFSFYVIDNHVLRFLGQRAFVEDDVPLSFLGFLAATLMLFVPWSLCLPAALRDGARKLRGATPEGKSLVFLSLWGGLIVFFFALSPLKLEHYGLPAFPALAVLVGKYWGDRLQAVQKPSVWLLTPLIALALPSLLIATRAVPLDDFVEAMFSTDVYSRMVQAQGQSYAMPLVDELMPLFQGSGVVLFCGAVATLAFAVRRDDRLALGCFALTAVILLGLVGKMQVLASEYRSVKPLVARIQERLGPTDLLIHEGPLENSAGLTFYTGRQIRVVDGRRGDLHFGSRFPEARGLFLDGEELSRRWQEPGRIFLVTDRPIDRSALRLVPPQARHLIGHEGRRWLFTNRPE
jgi:4-amino-4-deoxy-L-arabinose transferase-like glycosyltransferase